MLHDPTGGTENRANDYEDNRGVRLNDKQTNCHDRCPNDDEQDIS